MTRSSDAIHPAVPRGRLRVRILLAGLVAVGMAIAGLAFAAPANAKQGFPSLTVIATSDCDYNDSGQLSYEAYYLYSRGFMVTLTTVAGAAVDEWFYEGDDSGVVTTEVDPGEYRLSLYERWGDAEWQLADEASFTIGACSDLDVDLINPTCSTGDDGLITLVLSGLIVGESYDWSAGGFSGTLVAESDTVEIPLASGSPPGNYIAYAEWNGDVLVYDWQAFAIEPCQPELAVTVTQCTVAGGTGTVDVALANLVHGVVYTVTGPDGSTQQATAQPSGVTNLTFPSIAAGTDSTVIVEGTWTVDQPYEEPPYVGGGDFVPLDTVALTASADVHLEPCPAAVVPASSGTAGLPPTGTDPAGPVSSAVLLLGLGALTLLATARRRAGARTGK